MANIAQILQYKWPGAEWSIEDDDYETLVWLSSNIPKPTESEIRQYNNDVVQLINEERKAERQRDKFASRPDSLIMAVDVLADNLKQINDSLKPSAVSQPINSTRLNALIDFLEDIKNSQ